MCKYEIDESHYEVIIAKMFRYELDVKRLEKGKSVLSSVSHQKLN